MGRIARLSLTDFRNYRDASIEAGPGFVLLSGPNGAGKTNVLEAVSLLTPGRGLRQVPISEMARSDGAGGFALAARLDEGTELGTGTSPVAPDRRQVRINGAAASVNSLSEWLSVLWLTPAMDRLFADSAGSRRRFLDRLTLALEPGHAARAGPCIGVAAVHDHRRRLAFGSGQLLAVELHRRRAEFILCEDGRRGHRLAVVGRQQRHVVAARLHPRMQTGGDEPFCDSNAHG